MSIFQMSISAGLLAIIVIIIRSVALNRLPKMTFLVLWGIVLLRLLIPIDIPSQYSVYNIIDGIFNKVTPTISINENVLPTYGGTVGQNIPTAQQQGLNIKPITTAWFIGMVAMFIFFAVIYYKNHRALRFSMIIHDNDFLNEWLAEHKLHRSITILQSDRITTPIAVGIFNSRIILPTSTNMDNKELLRYVLTHEYCHIKRFDTLWKMLLAVAVCVHWFNPMVWIMFVLVNRDLELACDETVIRRFGAETKQAYAYTLIGMAEQKSKFTPLYNGFAKNAAEERIVSIMKYKKSTITVIVIAVLLVVGATTAFAASALTSYATDNNSDKTITEKDAAFSNENGNKQPVSNGQVNQAGRFSLNEDGTITPAQNDDSLLDGFNVSPFSFGNSDLLNNGNVSYDFNVNENADPYDFSETRSQSMQQMEYLIPRTYTDEEMAQIIADIESGKIQPYTPKDGESGILFDGEKTIIIGE